MIDQPKGDDCLCNIHKSHQNGGIERPVSCQPGIFEYLGGVEHSLKQGGYFKNIFLWKFTTLIPESCWESIIITAMNNGHLSVSLNMSLKVTFGWDLAAEASSLIESSSVPTSSWPLNFFKSFSACSCRPLLIKLCFGDSGQKVNVASWKMQGRTVNAKIQGHLCSFPRRAGSPMICATRIEIVTSN